MKLIKAFILLSMLGMATGAWRPQTVEAAGVCLPWCYNGYCCAQTDRNGNGECEVTSACWHEEAAIETQIGVVDSHGGRPRGAPLPTLGDDWRK